MAMFTFEDKMCEAAEYAKYLNRLGLVTVYSFKVTEQDHKNHYKVSLWYVHKPSIYYSWGIMKY